MVSSMNNDQVSLRLRQRNRAVGAACLPGAQAQTARRRKQKITSRMSDSGFEEELHTPTPSPSPSPERPDGSPRQVSNWHRHYGDLGYQIERERETLFHPAKCLARQPQVTAEARCKLVSWLIPVHRHFHLSFECCCLAVNIMDRFLASTPVAADCFQLLGVTALLLASKQVEMFSPRVSQLLSLCCDTFTKEQFCNLECLVLLRLNFRLTVPTLAFFLDYYSTCGAAEPPAAREMDGSPVMEPREWKRLRRFSAFAQRVCELSLADYAFNKYPPSLTALCALRITGELLRAGEGPGTPSDQPQAHQRWQGVLQPQAQQGPMVNDPGSDEQPLADSGDLSVSSEHGDLSGSSEHGDLPVMEESHSDALVRECRENLKLLVSLNEETLRVMSTM